MKILFLGPKDSPLLRFLRKDRQTVSSTAQPLNWKKVRIAGYDMLISYGYRYKVPKDVLELFPKGAAINLHISYLPWNKGADPNLWSWIDDTPKGITIHEMNEEIDGGEIIAQAEVPFPHPENETLKTSYEKLSIAMVEFFKETWPVIKKGPLLTKPHTGGTYHFSKERERVQYLLTKGWDTPVSELKIG